MSQSLSLARALSWEIGSQGPCSARSVAATLYPALANGVFNNKMWIQLNNVKFTFCECNLWLRWIPRYNIVSLKTACLCGGDEVEQESECLGGFPSPASHPHWKDYFKLIWIHITHKSATIRLIWYTRKKRYIFILGDKLSNIYVTCFNHRSSSSSAFYLY